MFDTLSKNTLVPLIVRLALAVVFVYHGLDKVTGENNQMGTSWNRKPADKPEAPDPPPAPMQALVAWGELVGGLAMAAGFLTRLAAVGLAVIMVGAIVTVTGSKGFSSLHGGYEYNFVLLMLCAAAMLLGSGRLGVDRLFRLRRNK